MKLTITNDRNEVDQNAMGGTELMGAGLHKYVDEKLLSKFNIIRSRVRHISDERQNILWLHDLPQDPESAKLRDPAYLAQFDRLVYVSNWQKDMYQGFHGIPASKGVVIKNAIEPIPAESIVKSEDEIRLIYHPTPHRGLELLYPVFVELAKEFPELRLDVFSSFKLYGWEQRDEPYRELFKQLEAHPQITYHGSQPQDVVRDALAKAHIFAYPSIWQETSCICAMEAMSAACLMVLPNYAALPETTAGYAIEYDWTEDTQEHVNRFYSTLRGAIQLLKRNAPGLQRHLFNQKAFADNFYCWESRKLQWQMFLNNQLVHRNQIAGGDGSE